MGDSDDSEEVYNRSVEPMLVLLSNSYSEDDRILSR